MSYQSQWDAFREDILASAHRIKARHPDAWEEVKVPGQTSRRFISLVAAECQTMVNMDIGCNLKRGGPAVSLDVLAMPNASGAQDVTGRFPGLELRDIIGNAERADAYLTWGDATPATIAAGVAGGWIKSGNMTPAPPVSTMPSYEALGGDAFFRAQVGDTLQADMAEAGQPHLNAGSSVWFSRTTYSLMVAMIKAGGPVDPAPIVKKHRNEWRAILGLPPV